jgi:methylthioribose-1-phosphate isomerase
MTAMSNHATSTDETFSPIRWDGGLKLLDQTRLPTAAYGLVVGLETRGEGESLDDRFAEVAEYLGRTRPTAVNLRWAIEIGSRMFATTTGEDDETRIANLLEWAQQVHADDIASCRRIGEFGAELFSAADRVLTHCNTGALATGGYGTALGVIQSSFEQGKVSNVWVDETRPLLQGARLTAWELGRLGIPYKLVTDSSVGSLMSRGLVDRVVLGADRIAANGDTANKIGTYTVAVMAARHDVPFYVAAPLSTIDREAPTGNEIPIEERSAAEVTEVFGTVIAPDDAPAANFAFDVTPHELITAIITDVGVLEPPFTAAIDRAFEERDS